MTDQEITHRAQEARRLANDPLLVEALERLEKQAVEDIVAVRWWNRKRRDQAVEKIRAIRGIRAELQAMIAHGEQKTRKQTGII